MDQLGSSGGLKLTWQETETRKATLSTQEQHRERLQNEIAKVEKDLAELEERLSEKGDYSLGEGDPSIYLWEMNLARRERLQSRLEELRAAMTRLEAGTYDICSVCGDHIEPGRLELVPTTRVCSRCARGGR